MTAQEELARRIERDSICRAVQKKIDEGKADFSDTARYNDRAAELLGEVLAAYVPDMPPEERETLCKGLLRQRYTDTNAMLNAVQRALDAAQGLHLAPQIADYPEERVNQAAHALADETVPVETIVRRAKSAPATIARSFHDVYIEKNAAFRDSAGLKCYINRIAAGGCCKWCTAIAGRYRYGEEPDDIYRRHDNCSCTVTYESGRQRQDVWSKREWEAPEPGAGAGEPVRLTKEQAREMETQHPVAAFTPGQAKSLQEAVLTNAAGSGTMETAEERDKNAARRRYDAMTREQRVEVIRRGIRETDATFSYDTVENHAMEYLRKAEPMPNAFDVRSHGTDSLIEFFKQDYPKDDIRSHIDAYTLARILRGREDFRRFLSDCRKRNAEPFVRLMSCNTGNTTNTGNCFAQLLANELGMSVYAPTKTLYANLDGSYQVGIMNDGEMKLFWPRRM